jgi:hypothetical protein
MGLALRAFLHKVHVPNGLQALGYTAADVPALAAGAMPQVRRPALVLLALLP